GRRHLDDDVVARRGVSARRGTVRPRSLPRPSPAAHLAPRPWGPGERASRVRSRRNALGSRWLRSPTPLAARARHTPPPRGGGRRPQRNHPISCGVSSMGSCARIAPCLPRILPRILPRTAYRAPHLRWHEHLVSESTRREALDPQPPKPRTHTSGDRAPTPRDRKSTRLERQSREN